MPAWSHTSLEKFESCPLAYRYRYVERRSDALGETLEQYLGSVVHSTLEWLHLRVHDGILPLWEEIRDEFLKKYDSGWSGSVRLVHPGRTRESYRTVGERCLRNYFENNTPFDRGSLLATEWQFRFPLAESPDAPVITGRIDRISRLGGSHLEIHDYKTSSFVPPREEVERSRQAALYALAVGRAFPESLAGRVEMVWHYLSSGIAFRFEVGSGRLERIRDETMSLIGRIASTASFEARPSRLCPWCEYSHVCPEFGYREQVRTSLEDASTAEPSIAIVDRLERLEGLRREFEKAYRAERKKIESSVASAARERGVSAVLGTRMEASVTGSGEGVKVRLRKKR